MPARGGNELLLPTWSGNAQRARLPHVRPALVAHEAIATRVNLLERQTPVPQDRFGAHRIGSAAPARSLYGCVACALQRFKPACKRIAQCKTLIHTALVTKPESKPAPRDPYLVKSVVHSSQLLSAFRSSGEALPLREIAARSGLPKSMTFRLLYTLERCGMVEKVGENLYRSSLRPFKQKLYRIGYAAQGTDYQFSKEVSAGLQRAAAAEGVELISVDNRYNPKIAQRNADVLVRERVDLVIEFQTDEQIAPMVAAKYSEANIPLIAIEIPHPGATYFGANNYEAGLIGGRYLGRWARQRWHGEVDEIVLIGLKRAGSLPQMRMTGMLVGMKEVCPHLEQRRVTYLDGDGVLGDSFEAMRKHLRSSKARRIAVGAVND